MAIPKSTPNLDRLASMSNVFEQCYIGSFPTTPNRRDIHLSKGQAPGHAFNPWKNFEPDEITLAARLGRQGVHTMMITDVQNGVTKGRNMFQGFQFYKVNRGQEGDTVFPTTPCRSNTTSRRTSGAMDRRWCIAF